MIWTSPWIYLKCSAKHLDHPVIDQCIFVHINLFQCRCNTMKLYGKQSWNFHRFYQIILNSVRMYKYTRHEESTFFSNQNNCFCRETYVFVHIILHWINYNRLDSWIRWKCFSVNLVYNVHSWNGSDKYAQSGLYEVYSTEMQSNKLVTNTIRIENCMPCAVSNIKCFSFSNEIPSKMENSQ